MKSSLQFRLLYPLFWLWVVSATIAASTGFWLVGQSSDLSFDRILADDARALATQIKWTAQGPEFSLDAQMAASLIYDSFAPSNYSVQAADGRVLVGDSRLKPDPAALNISSGSPLFNSVELNGRHLRVVTLRVVNPDQSAHAWVMVAEDQSKRQHYRDEMATAIFGPAFLIGFVGIPLLIVGVRYGLGLATRTSAQVESRSLADLSPLPLDDVPQELQALVTRINALLAKLKATMALERQFIAEAAHQLRTPVSGIRLLIQDLSRNQQTNPASPPDPEVLTELDSAAQRASHLVQQMLALARAESGAGGQSQNIHLPGVIKGLESSWLRLAEREGKHFSCILPDRDVCLNIDKLVLQDAMNNLVENALLHGGTTCQIEVLERNSAVMICVTDNGPRISDETLAQMKKPFWRSQATQKPGTGLGLAIADKAAQAFGGVLEIERLTADGGTRISLIFPA